MKYVLNQEAWTRYRCDTSMKWSVRLALA